MKTSNLIRQVHVLTAQTRQHWASSPPAVCHYYQVAQHSLSRFSYQAQQQ